MTSLIPYLFGKQPWSSNISNLAGEAQQPHQKRNRLKKPAPIGEIHLCEELLDIVHSQSYLTLRPNESNTTVVYRGISELESRSINPPSRKEKISNNSISLYSHHEMKQEEFRRTRAKTPVFRIGQLEGLEDDQCIDLRRDIDAATALAQQYQDVLPIRGFTPLPQTPTQHVHRNGLRRIKCHDSLRDIAKEDLDNAQYSGPPTPRSLVSNSPDSGRSSNPETQESTIELHMRSLHSSRSRFRRGSFENRFNRRHSSDSETLVGSDTETSPSSPWLHSFSNFDFEKIRMLQDCPISSMQDDLIDSTIPETNVSMQLCVDLLTNDLATALYKQHPTEGGNRVSGLQILLMIEAYERLQQQLREDRESSHVTGVSEDHVKAVESTLDHWLQALRSIYERSLYRGRGTLHDSVHA